MVSLNPDIRKNYLRRLQRTYLLLHSEGFLQEGVQYHTFDNRELEIFNIFESCQGNNRAN